MAEIDVGDALPIYVDFKNVAGAAADPTTVALSIVKPDATVLSPSPTHPSLGRYEYTIAISQTGRWTYTWTGTGAVAAVERGSFMVRASVLNAEPGSLVANSYLTVAEADEIAANRGLGPAAADWLSASDSDKEKALMRASSEVDAHLGTVGTRWDTLQALLFPRYVDEAIGLPFILPNVRLATYEQAVYVLRNAEVMDNANTRRARGLISFSDDDGSGSVVAARPDFGTMSPQALILLKQIRGLGRATLRSVRMSSSYVRTGSLLYDA